MVSRSTLKTLAIAGTPKTLTPSPFLVKLSLSMTKHPSPSAAQIETLLSLSKVYLLTAKYPDLLDVILSINSK